MPEPTVHQKNITFRAIHETGQKKKASCGLPIGRSKRCDLVLCGEERAQTRGDRACQADYGAVLTRVRRRCDGAVPGGDGARGIRVRGRRSRVVIGDRVMGALEVGSGRV